MTNSTFEGNLVCPYCQNSFPLTWHRYWSAPLGGHRCPQCRKVSHLKDNSFWVWPIRNLSGVGSFQGENFQTKQATVRNSGVGSAVVNVSEQLDATVSGVGSIEYIGSPQVRESGRGVGSVKKR